jgi:hypothetical protein
MVWAVEIAIVNATRRVQRGSMRETSMRVSIMHRANMRISDARTRRQTHL